MRKFWSILAVQLGKRAGLVSIIGLIITLILGLGIPKLGDPLVHPIGRGADDDRGTTGHQQSGAGHPDPARRPGARHDRGAAAQVEGGRCHRQPTAAVKDSSRTSMPSWSRSSEIDSAGRKRKTLP